MGMASDSLAHEARIAPKPTHSGGHTMAAKKNSGARTHSGQSQKTTAGAATGAAAGTMDQRLTAFAEHLGTLVGTLQNKAEELVDREALARELSSLKDDASGLLDQLGSFASSVGARTAKGRRPAAPASKKETKRADRGPVDAPGKRHRQPPPQKRVSRSMNQAKGTQTAPKLGTARRRGRG
jgi:hypothetical protein